MTEPQRIDWHRTPYLVAVLVLALVFTILGVLAMVIGLAAPLFFGAVFLTAAAVTLGVGVIGWMIYASALFWRHESRNQMFAICEAVVRYSGRESGAEPSSQDAKRADERAAWWNRPEYRS